jgi:pimeloyl-ACP methyl ester carboxylesterase
VVEVVVKLAEVRFAQGRNTWGEGDGEALLAEAVELIGKGQVEAGPVYRLLASARQAVGDLEGAEGYLRQAVGLPGLNRLVRLGGTTCGDDTKVEAGLSVDRLRGITVPVLALYGEHSPFLATAAFLAEQLPNCRSLQVPDAKHRAPEENGPAFVAIVHDFLNEVDRASPIVVPA